MELSLLEIWESMGFLARAVAVSLLGMGFVSLALGIERFFALRRAMKVSEQFAKRARPLMEDGDFETVLEITRSYKNSPLAKLCQYGLETLTTVNDSDKIGKVERTRRELSRRLEELSVEAKRGMGFLASTGSTAPFIGLFGTVIGIITAFQGIAASGGGGIDAVSAGIAEALIVTAVGLFVAIAAVLGFNYLTTRLDRLEMAMQHAASELLDFVEGKVGSA